MDIEIETSVGGKGRQRRQRTPRVDTDRLSDAALWSRIAAHPLDAATGSEPYSVKLAADAGWSPNHTIDVIEEYRRYLYLTQIASEPLDPPGAVDAAWRMHLTFTRNYWDVLCPEVLQARLHYTPMETDADADPGYARTHALYKRTFGARPPSTIWGDPDRTGAETEPKLPRVLYQSLTGFGFAAIVPTAAAAFIGWTQIAIVAGIVAAALFAGAAWHFYRNPGDRWPANRSGSGSGSDSDGGGCGD